MQKLVFGVEYRGNAYHGWQIQKQKPSIQGCLEHAISKIANEPIKIFGSSRTDAGVHALEQILHFETTVSRSYSAWTSGVNSILPSDISIRWMSIVKKDFHARFSAIARRYIYIIYNNPLRSVQFFGNSMHYFRTKLDFKRMENSGQCLLGEHDFSSFRSSNCQSYSPNRNLHHLYVKKFFQSILIDIQSNSFVHHMVRNIVGSLIEVGCGHKPESWIYDLLIKRNRTMASMTVPAQGLYLVKVLYPSYYNFPT